MRHVTALAFHQGQEIERVGEAGLEGVGCFQLFSRVGVFAGLKIEPAQIEMGARGLGIEAYRLGKLRKATGAVEAID